MQVKHWIPAIAALLGLGVGIGLRVSGPAPSQGGQVDGREVPLESNRLAVVGEVFDPGVFLASAKTRRPNFDAVIQARGLTQYAVLAQYLAKASAEDCRSLHDHLKRAGELTHHFKDMIFLRWAEVDPVGGYRMSRSLWAWGKTDPDAALAFALERGKGWAVVRAVGQEDASAGRALLERYPQFESETVWEGIGGGLAGTDLQKSAEYAIQHGLDKSAVLKTWTDIDPDAALEFALGQKDPGHREFALERVIESLAASDPKRAHDVLDSLPVGEMRFQLREDLLRISVGADPDAAIERALSLENAKERDRVLKELVPRLAHSRPERVLEMIVEASASKEAWVDQIPHQLHWMLAESDPKGTLDSLQDVSGRGAQKIVEEVASRWVQVEPELASTWIRDEASGSARDAMVQGLVDGMLAKGVPDFGAATAWASTLSNSPATLDNVLKRWIWEDPTAARRAIEGGEIGSEVVREAYGRLGGAGDQ